MSSPDIGAVDDAESGGDTVSDIESQIEVGWPYAVTPASDDVQRRLSDREMKMEATNGEIYAGSRAREMIEYAQQSPEQPRWVGKTERDNKDVSLPYDLLFRHVFVGGLTGMGKSTFEKNIVQQHIYAGKGVCYIDPKGDDVIDILASIPKDRWEDVIYISPGSEEFAKRVGFNLLDTYTEEGDPRFNREVEGIVDDMKALLAADDFWGPLMDGVASNMLRAMIRHPFDFTMVDMFGALLDEDSRSEYADLIQASDEDLSMVEGYAQKIAELEDTDLDAIRRRLKDWVEEPMMRQIIAQRDAEASIPDAVENEKIILVNNNLSPEPQKAIATAILRQVWTAVDSRPSERDLVIQRMAEADDGGLGEFDEEAVDAALADHRESGKSFAADYSPFFLVIDEAHDVLSEGDKIDKMLAKARSKKLGLTIASQQLRQLNQDAQDAILGNCNTLITYDPAHPDEARLLSRRFGEKDDQDLLETDQFFAWMRTATGPGKRSRPFLAEAFPPYPPLHGVKDTYRLIVSSLDRYGTQPPSSDEVQSRMHFSASSAPSESELLAERLDESHEQRACKVVYDACLRAGDDALRQGISFDSFVTAARDAFEPPISDAPEGTFQQLKDRLVVSGVLVEEVDGDGESRYRASEDAVFEIFDQGKSPTAAKEVHRRLVRESYKMLVRRTGSDVEIPIQGGSKDVADLVINQPVEFSSNRMEADAQMDAFADDHPLLHLLTRGAPTAVEIECSTGRSSPKKTSKNLLKAVDEYRRCLYVCPEGRSDEPFDFVAEKVWQTATDPERVGDVRDDAWSVMIWPHDVDAEPVMYRDGETRPLSEFEADSDSEAESDVEYTRSRDL